MASARFGDGCTKRPARGWGVALLCVLLCTAAPAFAAPQHVVSVNVCTDEYLFRLLPRTRIAALSYLAGDRHPVVSTIADKIAGIRLIRQSMEDVLASSPDLVVMDQGASPRLRAHLMEAGVPTLEVPWVSTLDDVRKTTRMLGEKLDARARAEALLAEMDRKIAIARARALHPPVRTLIYEPNGYATADGVTDEVMGIAGLVNAAPDFRQTRMGTIPVEEVIARAPELLILSAEEHARSARADLILHHPAFAALKGKTTTAWAPLTPLLCPGPWSLDAAVTFGALAKQARALAPALPRN